MMRYAFISGALLITMLLSACTVGPVYHKPPVPVPAAYKEIGGSVVAWHPAKPQDTLPRGKWWELYHDQALNALEEKLNVSNQNIAAAVANVEAARAVVKEAQSQFFPAVSLNPSITRQRASFAFTSQGSTFTAYSLPLGASWEPDLFGRVRNAVHASLFSAQAIEADLESVKLSEQAELATDYFSLRAQDEQTKILGETVAAYSKALELATARYASGAGTDEAVAQAQTQLKSAQAQLTSLDIIRAQYEHAIATLIGQPASSFALEAKPFSATPPAVPVGLPSDLLERRPDIAAAERSVAAANAQVGEAETAFFPSLTLGGEAGFQKFSQDHWLALPSLVWSVGPAVAQTIFDGGQRSATVKQFKAKYNATVATYRQTVLIAFQQVEDNLAALSILARAVSEQNAAVASAQRSLDEADARYKAGLDPYLNVITAQTALLADKQQAVNFRAQQMVADVQLVKALGGMADPH